MKLKTNKIKEMKAIVGSILELVDETKLKFDDKFIVFEAMDRANIAYTRLKILGVFFDEYVPSEDEIIFKVKDLKDFLDIPKEGDTLILKISEDKSSLVLEIMGNFQQNYTMPLLTELAVADIPKTEMLDKVRQGKYNEIYKNIIKTDKDKFDISIQNLNKLGSAPLVFYVKDNKFAIKKQEDLKRGEVFLGKHEGEDSISKFNSSYIAKFCKLLPISENVEVCLRTDYPLLLNINKMNGFVVNYLMAPLVEPND